MSVITKIEGFLETAGKEFAKGLGFAVKEAPAVSALAALLYPPSMAVAPLVVGGLSLLQNSVVSIEQKYAAANLQNGTGTQKAAEVLALSGPAATQMLTAAGVPNVTDVYIGNIITAIVGVLNAAQPAKA